LRRRPGAGGPPRPGRRRAPRLLCLALLALASALAAACGAEASTEYRDAEHGLSFAYPPGEFAPGPLSTLELIAAAHRAAGATPLKVVQVVADDGAGATGGGSPRAGAAGMLVAVYERPDALRSAGLWLTGDALIGSALPEARRAVAPAATIGEPRKVRFEGMEAYWADFTVATGEGAVEGSVMVADGDRFVYEVIVQLPAGSAAEALPALGRVFLSLRLS
jgi:hypothetical protein